MISQPFKGYTEAVLDQTRPCYVNAANFLNYARIQLCTLIGTHHLHTHRCLQLDESFRSTASLRWPLRARRLHLVSGTTNLHNTTT